MLNKILVQKIFFLYFFLGQFDFFLQTVDLSLTGLRSNSGLRGYCFFFVDLLQSVINELIVNKPLSEQDFFSLSAEREECSMHL